MITTSFQRYAGLLFGLLIIVGGCWSFIQRLEIWRHGLRTQGEVQLRVRSYYRVRFVDQRARVQEARVPRTLVLSSFYGDVSQRSIVYNSNDPTLALFDSPHEVYVEPFMSIAFGAFIVALPFLEARKRLRI